MSICRADRVEISSSRSGCGIRGAVESSARVEIDPGEEDRICESGKPDLGEGSYRIAGIEPEELVSRGIVRVDAVNGRRARKAGDGPEGHQSCQFGHLFHLESRCFLRLRAAIPIAPRETASRLTGSGTEITATPFVPEMPPPEAKTPVELPFTPL